MVNIALPLRGTTCTALFQLPLLAVADAVADHAAARGVALLDAGMYGPTGDVVEGIGKTLAALADGRLHTLFVADDPADERIARFGEELLCAEVHIITAAQAKAFDDHIGGLCRYRPATPA